MREHSNMAALLPNRHPTSCCSGTCAEVYSAGSACQHAPGGNPFVRAREFLVPHPFAHRQMARMFLCSPECPVRQLVERLHLAVIPSAARDLLFARWQENRRFLVAGGSSE